MGRTRRQELFWLGLIVLCIALFVAHRAEHPQQQSAGYDRQSMDALVAKTNDPDADIVTGSIVKAPRKATAAKKYYVSFGDYSSIDAATSRYLDVIARKPVLKDGANIEIKTGRAGAGVQHSVRMGAFSSAWAARTTCLKAGFRKMECKVLPSS